MVQTHSWGTIPAGCLGQTLQCAKDCKHYIWLEVRAMGKSCFTSQSHRLIDGRSSWCQTAMAFGPSRWRSATALPLTKLLVRCVTIGAAFQNSIQVALLVSQPVRLGTDTNLHWKQTVPGQTLDVQNTPQTRAAEITVKLSAARQGIVAASELDTSEEGGFFAFQVFRLEVD